MKLGVSLAGGGVKGAAHIGALKALEEKNIPIDYLSGTSSGSIVTTLYGAGYSCNEILNIFYEYSKKIKYIDFKNIFNIVKRLVCERKFRIEGFNTGEIIENLEQSHKDVLELTKEIEQKDKQIDLMAEIFYKRFKAELLLEYGFESKEEIKQYFERKVEDVKD